MPEYMIPVIERQVSRRYGWRRVTAVSLYAATTETFENPDDNATDWGAWDSGESRLLPDEDRTAHEAPPRTHGVMDDFVDKDYLNEPWSEQLRISDRLSLGCRLGHDEQRLYYAADGARGISVPLTDTALSVVPAEIRDLAYRLSNATRGECVTLIDACEIKAVFTSDAERALHDFLTGRPCG